MARPAKKPTPAAALAEVRARLDEYGMLLAHDAKLPSVSSIVAGQPVRGSWWGHPLGQVIFTILQQIEDETCAAKLVAGKVTLLSHRLRPALARVGSGGGAWQMRGLPKNAQALLELVAHHGRADTDLAKKANIANVARAAGELERRLLVASHEEHTPSGRHVRVLTSWPTWCARIGVRELPPLDEAQAALAEPVAQWVGEAKLAGLLPWLPKVR